MVLLFHAVWSSYTLGPTLSFCTGTCDRTCFLTGQHHGMRPDDLLSSCQSSSGHPNKNRSHKKNGIESYLYRFHLVPYCLCRIEFILSLFAARTFPIFRKIGKRSSVMFSRIINISANRTYIDTACFFFGEIHFRKNGFYRMI